jgi:long-chain acyl-CoA synthetase
MGYGSPRTLTDSNCRNCKGDLKELRPTLLVGVPAMWELVKKGITTQVNSGGPLVKAVFWSALYAKQLRSLT